jgi:hypothetical protein
MRKLLFLGLLCASQIGFSATLMLQSCNYQWVASERAMKYVGVYYSSTTQKQYELYFDSWCPATYRV